MHIFRRSHNIQFKWPIDTTKALKKGIQWKSRSAHQHIIVPNPLPWVYCPRRARHFKTNITHRRLNHLITSVSFSKLGGQTSALDFKCRTQGYDWTCPWMSQVWIFVLSHINCSVWHSFCLIVWNTRSAMCWDETIPQLYYKPQSLNISLHPHLLQL